MRNCVVIIPALNPPEILEEYVKQLNAEGFEKIIIVDDGSCDESKSLFRYLEDAYCCDLLVHAVNMGKGRALKDALNYYLVTYSGSYKGVITADSDGQHLVKDVVRMDDEIGLDDSALLLGVRDFGKENVPFKSRAGNRITRNILKILIGGNVTDTQTGLRGIPNQIIYEYLTLTGERFEYETTMLIESIKKDIPIREIRAVTANVTIPPRYKVTAAMITRMITLFNLVLNISYPLRHRRICGPSYCNRQLPGSAPLC